MPLDTSTYHLAHLRLDGRRWNELRRTFAQISTQPTADGSSYLEMGLTKVLCTVSGPAETRSSGRQQENPNNRGEATVTVEIAVAGFSSSTNRKRRGGRGDKQTTHLQQILRSTFQRHLSTTLYPSSTIALTIQILSQDGSLLAACLNASTLALIDAGVPMRDYVVACTSGLCLPASGFAGGGKGSIDDTADPFLDLNALEESELAFLTVGTLGAGDRVVVCVLEGRVHGGGVAGGTGMGTGTGQLEGMLVVGVDGCKRMRGILDAAVRERGRGSLGRREGVS